MESPVLSGGYTRSSNHIIVFDYEIAAKSSGQEQKVKGA